MAAESRPELNLAGKAALLFYVLFTGYSSVALVPILPAITRYFSATPNADVLTRSLLSLTGIVLAVGAPITGVVANKLGWRRMLLAGAVLFTVAGTAGAFVTDLYALLGSRVIFAIGVAIFGTLMLALITIEFEGDRRNRWLGVSMLLSACSSVAFVVLAGYLASMDWRYVFMAHATGVLLIALIWFGVREPQFEKGPAAKSAGGKIPWGMLAIGLAVGVAINGPTLFISYHLVEVGIKDPQLISIALVSSVIAGAIAAAFFGSLRKRLPARATFVLSFLCLAVGLTMIGMSQNFWMAVAGGW